MAAIEQRAEDLALAYAATAPHNGEVIDSNHLRAAVSEAIRAAVLDDRAERVELRAAILADRAATAEILATEAMRLRGLAGLDIPDAAAYSFAASICERMEAAIRARG